MKKIIIFLGITCNLFSVEQNSIIYVFQEHIPSILGQSKTVDELNNRVALFELSGDKRIKQIINANALKIIYYYLQNKFHGKFDFSEFEKNAINKGPLYSKYIDPIIFMTQNSKLNALNRLLISGKVNIDINLEESYENITTIIRRQVRRLPSVNNADIEIQFKFLLKMGLVNFKDTLGDTALITSINLRDSDIAYNISKQLIDAGADVNIQNNIGDLALIRASQNGRINIVKLLIDHNANINIQDKHGWTALMVASVSYNLYSENIIKLLVESGAAINIQNKSGNTALIEAAGRNKKNIVKLLIELGADINIKDNAGNTALMHAIEQRFMGRQDIVQMLIDNGADIHIKNNDNKTALMLASRNSDSDIVKLLKEKESPTNCIIQ